MRRRPPKPTRTDKLFPYTTLLRSRVCLVTDVVAPDDLSATVDRIADKICSNGPTAARLIKDLAYRGRDVPLHEGLRLYKEYQAVTGRDRKSTRLNSSH